jgi:probable rRNA maturation factor
MSIKITNKQKDIRIPIKKTRIFIETALKQLSLPTSTWVSVNFVDAKEIKKLNRLYFKKNRITDVIALGYEGSGGKGIYKDYLGDIIICPEAARRNAGIHKKGIGYELHLYMVHGLLHLLGYEDVSEKQALRIEELQQQVLGKVCRRLRIRI